MTKLTIELSHREYEMLRDSAAKVKTTIKDYVLNALRAKQQILVRDDGVVRVLNKKTIQALEESRDPKKRKKMKSYSSVEEAFADLLK